MHSENGWLFLCDFCVVLAFSNCVIQRWVHYGKGRKQMKGGGGGGEKEDVDVFVSFKHWFCILKWLDVIVHCCRKSPKKIYSKVYIQYYSCIRMPLTTIFLGYIYYDKFIYLWWNGDYFHADWNNVKCHTVQASQSYIKAIK